MKTIIAAAALSLATTPGVAQSVSTPAPSPLSLEQTFKELGGNLEQIERAISRPPAVSNSTADIFGDGVKVYNWGDAPPAPGAELTAATSITSFTGASPTAPAFTLPAGTKVQYQGIENGFVKIVPMEGFAKGTPQYVPQGAAKSGFISNFAGTRIKDLMEQAGRVAVQLRDNPHVRLKGFKVNVSISPSLDLDFEMKATSPSATAQ